MPQPRSTRLVVHEGVHVKRSQLHGWGVFTNKEIKKGDTVEECVVPYDILPLDSNALKNYRFVWPSRKKFTGACLPLGFGSIYNHSKGDPNIDWDIDAKERVVTFTALKDIAAGEELLFDYASAGMDFM